MSTKATYRSKVYVINDDQETMKPDRTPGPPIPIPWGSEDLVVDPTDSQLSELGWPGNHNQS